VREQRGTRRAGIEAPETPNTKHRREDAEAAAAAAGMDTSDNVTIPDDVGSLFSFGRRSGHR